MINHGESVRVMSGDHGTVVVGTGDEFPDWFTPAETETADVEVTETDDGESD